MPTKNRLFDSVVDNDELEDLVARSVPPASKQAPPLQDMVDDILSAEPAAKPIPQPKPKKTFPKEKILSLCTACEKGDVGAVKKFLTEDEMDIFDKYVMSSSRVSREKIPFNCAIQSGNMFLIKFIVDTVPKLLLEKTIVRNIEDGRRHDREQKYDAVCLAIRNIPEDNDKKQSTGAQRRWILDYLLEKVSNIDARVAVEMYSGEDE